MSLPFLLLLKRWRLLSVWSSLIIIKSILKRHICLEIHVLKIILSTFNSIVSLFDNIFLFWTILTSFSNIFSQSSLLGSKLIDVTLKLSTGISFEVEKALLENYKLRRMFDMLAICGNNSSMIKLLLPLEQTEAKPIKRKIIKFGKEIFPWA